MQHQNPERVVMEPIAIQGADEAHRANLEYGIINDTISAFYKLLIFKSRYDLDENDKKLLKNYLELLQENKLSTNAKITILHIFFSSKRLKDLSQKLLYAMFYKSIHARSTRKSQRHLLLEYIRGAVLKDNLAAIDILCKKINKRVLYNKSADDLIAPLNAAVDGVEIYYAPKPESSWSQTIGNIAFWLFPPTCILGLLSLGVSSLFGKWLGKVILPATTLEKFDAPATPNFDNIVDIDRRLAAENAYKNRKRVQVYTHDNAILDTVEIQPNNSEGDANERMHIINFVTNGNTYEDFISEMCEDAVAYNANVIGFNHRGVNNSVKKPKSTSDLVIDGIAQVQRLLDRHVPPEKIILKGRSIGAGIASLVAKHFHDKGQPLYIFNGISFSNLCNLAVGYIKCGGTSGHYQPLWRSILGELARPFIKFGLFLTGWEIEASDAFKGIPQKNRQYILIRSRSINKRLRDVRDGLQHQQYRTIERVDDPIITHVASMHADLKAERKITKNAIRKNYRLSPDRRVKERCLRELSLFRNHKMVVNGDETMNGHNLPYDKLKNRYDGKSADQFFTDFVNHAKRNGRSH